MSTGRRLDEILASAAGDEPSDEQLRRLDARLAPLLVPPGGGAGGGGGGGHAGGGGATAAAGAVKAAKGGAALKWLWAVVIGAGVAGGGVAVHHLATRGEAPARPPAARAALSAPGPAQALAPVSATPDAGAVPPDAGSAPPDAASAGRSVAIAERPRHHHAGSSDSAGALAAETHLLDRAQAALREGAARTALSLCQRHAHRFPRGALREERERIAIEALLDLGRRAEAAARARAFEKRFPDSVQLPRIHALLGQHR